MPKPLTIAEASEIRRIYCRTKCGKPTHVCISCPLADCRAGVYMLKSIADVAIEYVEKRGTT